MAQEQSQIAVRVPVEWLSQLDALGVALSRPGLQVTRTDAIRMCIARGLEEFEREHATQRPKPKR